MYDLSNNAPDAHSHITGVAELLEISRVLDRSRATAATRFFMRDVNTSGFEHAVQHTGIDYLG